MKNVVKNRGFVLASLLLLLGITVAASGFSPAERADCPGKVVCPLTGEDVCKDQCPLVDANRLDCPGKVECPLTGKLVCRDECTLNAKNTEAEQELPPCCRGQK